MKTTILAAALLASVAFPAWAAPVEQVMVTLAERGCLAMKTSMDLAWRHSDGHMGALSTNTIEECKIPDNHVASAMDDLITEYTRNRQGVGWVESHCHAEPGIPHNKWVCTQGDITQEYR